MPHTATEIRAMLQRIGGGSLDELFAQVPRPLRLSRALQLPRPHAEQEVLHHLEALAARNENAAQRPCFLGAGAYAHFLPSAVDALVSRAEFTTAYTPYQAEISQGTLQAVFEWQTMLCELTGMQVANASLYDGASAAAEAALMALRITRRNVVAVSAGLHPHYREVLATYLKGIGARLRVARAPSPAALEGAACWLTQQPDFLGNVEALEAQARAAHAAGALHVVCVAEALSLALLRAPGASGADICCGEAQSFGVPLAYGGPHLGFLAAKQKHVRQMPGRIVGQTQDAKGRRGFVLTLATREQHIRRERATSNICTNQGLCLLMATIYLALLGRRGLRRLAEINLAKAEYLKAKVRAHPRLQVASGGRSFNEFAVQVPEAEAALARAREAGFIGGYNLAQAAPELGPALLVCATELVSRQNIDAFVAAIGGGEK